MPNNNRFRSLLLIFIVSAATAQSIWAKTGEVSGGEQILTEQNDELIKAQKLVEKGNYKEASQALKNLLVKHPDYYPANFELGKLAERDGDAENAVKYYNKAYQTNVNFAPALTRIGRIYQEQGKSEEAKNYFLLAWVADPQDKAALVNVSSILIENGQLKLAERILKKTPKEMKRKEAFELSLYNLGFAYFLQEKYKKARLTWNPLMQNANSKYRRYVEGLYYIAKQRE